MPKITIEVARGESDRDYVITAIDSNGNTRIRQFAGNERDATHRAFGMSVVFGAFYDQLRYIVDEKFDTLKHIGQHPAERRADELTAQLAEVKAERDKLQIDPQRVFWMTLAQQYKSDAMRFESERNAAIDSAEYYKHTFLGMQTRIDELTSERDAIRRAMNDYMNDAFAHTAPPTDWDQETPLGQMLDGMGDEVE